MRLSVCHHPTHHFTPGRRASTSKSHTPSLCPHNDLQQHQHESDNSHMIPFNTRTRPAHQPVFEHLDTSALLFRHHLHRQSLSDSGIGSHASGTRVGVGIYKQMVCWPLCHYAFSHPFFCAPSTFPCEPLRKWIGYWKRIFSREWSDNTPPPKWHRDLWDTQLRHGESYREKWEYVRMNPVRAKLVAHPDEWPYQGELSVLPWIEQV